jgi:glc operon protein GlcG
MMRRLSLITMAAAAALMFGTAVHAQPAQAPAAAPPPLPDYGPTITLDQAMKAANAALAEAKKLNVIEGIAVVDNAGRLVYFIKMDNLRQIGVDLSQGKAHTSAISKLPSKAYEDRVAAGGAGTAVLGLGVVPSAGGIPIIVGGKMIGAIGVGGGPNGVVDLQVAQAGIDALK